MVNNASAKLFGIRKKRKEKKKKGKHAFVNYSGCPTLFKRDRLSGVRAKYLSVCGFGEEIKSFDRSEIHCNSISRRR